MRVMYKYINLIGDNINVRAKMIVVQPQRPITKKLILYPSKISCLIPWAEQTVQ